jgi:hypothetical protein
MVAFRICVVLSAGITHEPFGIDVAPPELSEPEAPEPFDDAPPADPLEDVAPADPPELPEPDAFAGAPGTPSGAPASTSDGRN